jgi:hypothetical protein
VVFVDRISYLDFEIKIEREGEEYAARVLRSPVGEASTRFTVPFSEDRLALLTLKLSRPRATTRSVTRSDEIGAARELGGKLFEAVFSGEVRARLRSGLDEASRQEQTGLRLKLRLQDAPELADLPWEFLFDPSLDRFLAQSNRTPIVRYVELPERIRPLAVDLPLQILVMISSPLDPSYPRLDIEREEGMLRRALQPLSQAGKVQIDWLEDATLANLQRRLRGARYHIFHFIGHGGFEEGTGEGVLVLQDDQGRGWKAGAHRFATLLHDHPSLRLAVLNACEGARNSRRDPFAGVATTLIRHGIPAVVAMQFEITDQAAITFAGEFYTALAENYPVDAAVAEARKAVYAQPNDVEWATPVLYTRAPDGVLFDVRSALRPQERAAGSVEVVRTPVTAGPVIPAPPSPAPPRSGPPQPTSPSLGGRPETRARSWEETAAQVTAQVSAWFKDRGFAMNSTRVEGTLDVDAPTTVIRERAMRWAAAAEFTCTSDEPGQWVFERGSKAAMLYSIDIKKHHIVALVQAAAEQPVRVQAHLRTAQRGVLFTPGDRKYLSEQLEGLTQYLTGARS